MSIGRFGGATVTGMIFLERPSTDGSGFVLDRIIIAFDLLFRLSRAFLNPTDQLIRFAFEKLQVIIGELGEFLFQLSFRNVPVALVGKCIHEMLHVFAARMQT
jgi:hypothetical protein